jgi:peroxiredoxin
MNRVKEVLLVIMLALVVTVGFAVFGCTSDSTAPTFAQNAKVGSPAPDFQFYNSQEELVSLSDLRGEPVVLNFWATWCGPCVYEMPYLQEVYEEWSDNGLVLLTINMGGTASQVKEFLQDHDLSLPVLLDPNRNLAAQYNIRYVPTTFFIDIDGTIQAVKVGAFPNKEAMEDDLDKIMS